VTRRTVRLLLVSAAIVGVVALVGMSLPFLESVSKRLFDTSAESPADGAVSVTGADLSGWGPGSLVSATTMPAYQRHLWSQGIKAARVVYRSTSGDGQSTEVSGSVFTPTGDPPAGGWPVISYGHGSTGIDEPCAPSLSESLLGYADVVATLIKNGYAVALADFQGLGAPGVHPYLDARVAGVNMIDAVRALRATFPGVSNRWAAYGGSQGGGAAWAADEQARTYAPELELVGAVAISPAADVSGLADKAVQGTVTDEQELAVLTIVEVLARLHPDINRNDYRRGAVAQYWDILWSCSGSNVVHRNDAAKTVEPQDVAPNSPEAADRLRNYLRQWALPQQPLSAPLLVWYGGTDPYIDAPWTAAAIERACALGGTVTVQFGEDKGHGEVDHYEFLQWLAERFAGAPVANDCSQESR
jgi:alpha-beta hydrolase superfamily lysophospholipase